MHFLYNLLWCSTASNLTKALRRSCQFSKCRDLVRNDTQVLSSAFRLLPATIHLTHPGWLGYHNCAVTLHWKTHCNHLAFSVSRISLNIMRCVIINRSTHKKAMSSFTDSCKISVEGSKFQSQFVAPRSGHRRCDHQWRCSQTVVDRALVALVPQSIVYCELFLVWLRTTKLYIDIKADRHTLRPHQIRHH